MKFGPVPVRDALGAIVAHAVKQGDLILKKGVLIGQPEIESLRAAGVASVVVAQLESCDVGEDEAARLLALAIAGAGVRVEPPFTGRANLFAEVAGVLEIDTKVIDAVNSVDETITVATLAQRKAVAAGEMIGTVKIIPFAAEKYLLEQACAASGGKALSVAPFKPKRIVVISTILPGLKPSVVDKTMKVMASRLAPAGATIVGDRRIPHDAAALSAELQSIDPSGSDIIVVFGASAITDRADVIPAGIELAGGVVRHFGMPVDPGNLLLIGALGAIPIIGAPGCARSPRENGFDWVLQRLLADIPVTRRDIQSMGVGGLLMEIVSRPQPREGALLPVPARPDSIVPRSDIIVLAAGRSTRMRGPNKLLALHEGKPLIRHAVENALAAGSGSVMVVTGHQHQAVEEALAGLPVQFVQNDEFADGLSTSLKAGVAALAPECRGAVIVLGDMPLVGPGIIRRLCRAFDEYPGTRAVVPTALGERGNPVFIARALFPAVNQLSGDVGARKLIDAAGSEVTEIPVDDPGIHRDVDTPEALQQLWAENQ